MSTHAGSLRQRRPPARAESATRRIAPTTAALMALCALLLVGVVFVQIAAIRQNTDRSQFEDKATTVATENRNLEAANQFVASQQVAAWATAHGMVYADVSIAHPLTGSPANGG